MRGVGFLLDFVIGFGRRFASRRRRFAGLQRLLERRPNAAPSRVNGSAVRAGAVMCTRGSREIAGMDVSRKRLVVTCLAA